MSAQRLSEKSIRRLSRNTGLDIVRAWAHGGYTYDFVVAAETPDGHVHGWYDKKTDQWELEPWDAKQTHYNTCREMFPSEETT